MKGLSDKTLKAMWAEGQNQREIAARFSCTAATIGNRLKKLGLRPSQMDAAAKAERRLARRALVLKQAAREGKQCSACGEVKEVTEYRRLRGYHLSGMCGPCERARNAKRDRDLIRITGVMVEAGDTFSVTSLTATHRRNTYRVDFTFSTSLWSTISISRLTDGRFIQERYLPASLPRRQNLINYLKEHLNATQENNSADASGA